MKQTEIEAELKQLKNRHKILLNRKHKEERRERTHRLIEQGAILESIFPEVAAMTGNKSDYTTRRRSATWQFITVLSRL